MRWPQLEAGPSEQKLWWGLYKMVCESLRERLGGHGLFPEVRGQIAVGLMASKVALVPWPLWLSWLGFSGC